MRLREGTPVFLALVVRDLDASVAFYRDVLGMREIKSVRVSDAKAQKGRFAERGFFFRTFTLGPLALKLVEVSGTPAPTTGAVDSFAGLRYISLVVDDLDQACAALRAKGVAFLSDILPAEPDQRVGRLVFFRDPEGNLLELYGD